MFKRADLCYNCHIIIYILRIRTLPKTPKRREETALARDCARPGVYKILYSALGARKMGESALGKTLTFRRGVHPHEGVGEKRATGAKPIEAVPAPALAAIPLLQHAGAPASRWSSRASGYIWDKRSARRTASSAPRCMRRFRAGVKGIQPRIIAGGRVWPR